MNKTEKNTIKKAEMNGQLMDMQKTRGGVPACLRLVQYKYGTYAAHRNMLEKNGVRWIIGRTGWLDKTTPNDALFVHRTDEKKATYIYEFCDLCEALDDMYALGKTWRHPQDEAQLPAKRKKLIDKANSILSEHGFALTPKYAKLQKKHLLV